MLTHISTRMMTAILSGRADDHTGTFFRAWVTDEFEPDGFRSTHEVLASYCTKLQ
jgi:hypothetical protein